MNSNSYSFIKSNAYSTSNKTFNYELQTLIILQIECSTSNKFLIRHFSYKFEFSSL